MSGRPPLGPRLVEALSADAEAKQRLRVILETITAERTVAQACEELGIGESRFFELRTRALEGALLGLAPSPIGRPSKPLPEAAERVKELEAENLELKYELRAAQLREEIAVVRPSLLAREKKRLLTPLVKANCSGLPIPRRSRAGRKRT